MRQRRRFITGILCVLAVHLSAQTGKISKQELSFDPDLVLSWGQLYNDYLNFRERLGPLVPPNSVSYDDAGSKMAVNDWTFLNQNWLFKFAGGTRYVSSLSTMGITEPLTIQIYEDIRLGDIVILSSDITASVSKKTSTAQFKGEAIFTAPAFMEYETSFPRNKYLFDELAPRRVLWEITLKPQSYIQSDRQAQDAAAQAEQLRMAMMPKSAPAVLQYTDRMWMTIEFDNGTPVVKVHAPDTFTNRVEIYSTTNLVDGNWTVLTQGLSLLTANPVVYSVGGSNPVQFFTAGNMDIDSDGDGLPDSQERIVHHSNPYNADTDGDGLSDLNEVLNGTDPNQWSTGGSGVPDSIAVNAANGGLVVKMPNGQFRHVSVPELRLRSYGAY